MIYLLLIIVIIIFFGATLFLKAREEDSIFLSFKSIAILGVILIAIIGISYFVNSANTKLSKKKKSNIPEVTEQSQKPKKDTKDQIENQPTTQKSNQPVQNNNQSTPQNSNQPVQNNNQSTPQNNNQPVQNNTQTVTNQSQSSNTQSTQNQPSQNTQDLVKSQVISNNTSESGNGPAIIIEKDIEVVSPQEPQKEVTPTPAPEPQKEVTPTPEPEPQKEVTPTPVPEPQKEVTPTPTPVPEPQKEVTPTPAPEPQKEVTPTPAPKKEVLSPNKNKIYFFNLGASNDAFLLEDNGKFGLIDTSVKRNETKLVKELKKAGVKKLDFVMITHAHTDHTGGYERIMNSFSVKTLYIKKDGAKYPSHQSCFKKMINIAKKKKTNICDVKLQKCQVFNLGNTKIKLYNTEFFSSKGVNILHKGRFENANSITAVATINGRRIYFAGDIGNYFGYNQESKTAKKVGDVDIYKAAHHGYVTYNNHQDALSKIKPEYTVITNDRKRSKTTVQRLKKANKNYKKTYYTVEGTVKLTINKNGKIKFTQ